MTLASDRPRTADAAGGAPAAETCWICALVGLPSVQAILHDDEPS